MEKEELEATIVNEIPEYCTLLSDMTIKVTEVTKHVETLKQYVQKEEFSTVKGISLLELKYHTMLSYLINLVQLMLAKTRGESINGAPFVDRLIELRLVLEKIRPLEKQLHYQIDKLVKIATTGSTVSINDPLQYKPNINNLIPKVNEEVQEDENGIKTGKYVPPRVHAMPYEEDSDKILRKEKERKKVLKSSLLEDLKNELSDAPREIKDNSRMGHHLRKEREDERERERYEEDYFVRIGKRKRSHTEGMTETVNDLLDFGDLGVLTGRRGRGNRGDERSKFSKTTNKKRTLVRKLQTKKSRSQRRQKH